MKKLEIITRLNEKFTIQCKKEQFETYMDDICRVLDGELNYCIFPCDNGEVTLPSDTLRSSIIKHS